MCYCFAISDSQFTIMLCVTMARDEDNFMHFAFEIFCTPLKTIIPMKYKSSVECPKTEMSLLL